MDAEKIMRIYRESMKFKTFVGTYFGFCGMSMMTGDVKSAMDALDDVIAQARVIRALLEVPEDVEYAN